MEICLECFRNVQNRNLITALALIQRVGDPRRTHQSFAELWRKPKLPSWRFAVVKISSDGSSTETFFPQNNFKTIAHYSAYDFRSCIPYKGLEVEASAWWCDFALAPSFIWITWCVVISWRWNTRSLKNRIHFG